MRRLFESLAIFWSGLLMRGTGRATHFRSHGDAAGESRNEFAHWGLLATETWETAHTVVIRVEVPGISEGDLATEFRGRALCIRGEKRSGLGQHGRRYHLRERAYGKFQRRISLPSCVDPKHAEIAYRDGVLTVILPKTEVVPPRQEGGRESLK